MIPKGILRRSTLAQLMAAIAQKKRMDKVDRLTKERSAIAKTLEKLDRRIGKLNGNGAASTGRKPGRKKGYKLSAATRRKMSEAAKRRYAAKAAIK